ncbi:MAG: 2,3-bisphosphoglycerate-independent phosphoglycerate mutase [Deltaproteobacteria bacterium]|nr:2,3-bisphosphoglycerate-independent phosphoglycerate mutase [Deltaproteobacteria bacterium]
MPDLRLRPLPGTPEVPTVLCILDGVGWGRRDDGDAVFTAHTPVLDHLMATRPWRLLKAHGTAVGLPSDEDMGNSEVGHNALGAGRVFAQGALLVNRAIEDGSLFEGDTWRDVVKCPTLHLLGLVSDGNVHSHVRHLHALVRAAARDGVRRLRVHALTDGRDVPERSALTWIEPLETLLAEMSQGGRDFRIGSGGGRMGITMDRYEADWSMVQRGWACHVHGLARPFRSASEAIQTLYAEDPEITDQFLPAFVVADDGGPVGRIVDGDAVVLFNFRGDRALEISRAFENRALPATFDRSGPAGRPAPRVLYAGMMQYDGDLLIPHRYLVVPPRITRTVADFLAANGIASFAVSETQKFGHVTYFFNGNRSGPHDPALETWQEIPSDPGDFDQRPRMKAPEIARAASAAIRSGRYRHVRLNFPNGDMVGHTGVFDAAVRAVEAVDEALGTVVDAVEHVGGVLLVTADHGNSDQMYAIDPRTGAYAVDSQGHRQVRTSHSLFPVPFILVDFTGRYRLADDLPDAGLANVGASLLLLVGLEPPGEYLPGVVERQAEGEAPGSGSSSARPSGNQRTVR